MFAMLMLALSAEASVAGGAVANAKVVKVRIDNDGKGMVFFDKPIGGGPECVIEAYANALAFSGTNGKSIMALALAAKATNEPLTYVNGTGSCGVYGVAEDWRYGQ
jgi:hypothetical protein